MSDKDTRGYYNPNLAPWSQPSGAWSRAWESIMAPAQTPRPKPKYGPYPEDFQKPVPGNRLEDNSSLWDKAVGGMRSAMAPAQSPRPPSGTLPPYPTRPGAGPILTQGNAPLWDQIPDSFMTRIAKGNVPSAMAPATTPPQQPRVLPPYPTKPGAGNAFTQGTPPFRDTVATGFRNMMAPATTPRQPNNYVPPSLGAGPKPNVQAPNLNFSSLMAPATTPRPPSGVLPPYPMKPGQGPVLERGTPPMWDRIKSGVSDMMAPATTPHPAPGLVLNESRTLGTGRVDPTIDAGYGQYDSRVSSSGSSGAGGDSDTPNPIMGYLSSSGQPGGERPEYKVNRNPTPYDPSTDRLSNAMSAAGRGIQGAWQSMNQPPQGFTRPSVPSQNRPGGTAPIGYGTPHSAPPDKTMPRGVVAGRENMSPFSLGNIASDIGNWMSGDPTRSWGKKTTETVNPVTGEKEESIVLDEDEKSVTVAPNAVTPEDPFAGLSKQEKDDILRELGLTGMETPEYINQKLDEASGVVEPEQKFTTQAKPTPAPMLGKPTASPNITRGQAAASPMPTPKQGQPVPGFGGPPDDVFGTPIAGLGSAIPLPYESGKPPRMVPPTSNPQFAGAGPQMIPPGINPNADIEGYAAADEPTAELPSLDLPDEEVEAEPGTPAFDKYMEHLATYPEYQKPRWYDRVIAGVVGAGTGGRQGAAAGFEAAQGALNSRNNQEIARWATKNKALGEAAEMEGTTGMNSLKSQDIASRIGRREVQNEADRRKLDQADRRLRTGEKNAQSRAGSLALREREFEIKGYRREIGPSGEAVFVDASGRGRPPIFTGFTAIEYRRFLQQQTVQNRQLGQGDTRIRIALEQNAQAWSRIIEENWKNQNLYPEMRPGFGGGGF